MTPPAIRAATGTAVGKRQVETPTQRAAEDFEAFHASRPRPPAGPQDVVIISADGKGVVMRPGALGPATASAASKATPKLETRLSKGEKRKCKRMAEVGAVYTVIPVSRVPADVLASASDGTDPPKAAPKTNAKWLTASVVNDAATVAAVFDEAERRDATHEHPWVALVDGNNHQIDRIHAEAARRDVKVTTIIDLCRARDYADSRCPLSQKAV